MILLGEQDIRRMRISALKCFEPAFSITLVEKIFLCWFSEVIAEGRFIIDRLSLSPYSENLSLSMPTSQRVKLFAKNATP